MFTLVMGGISATAGAIADALTSNRGASITTRQSAAYRPIVYGVRQVGGTLIYSSTTGSHHDQYNMVIVLAGHQCHAIENLYLDGRKVFWSQGSVGNTTRNGINFGGSSDGNTYIGPDGAHYNFGGPMVYCEARYGDQSPGDVIGGLTANDPVWAAGPNGSPYVGGCTYVYLKIEYDTSMFPSRPEIRFTVHGKDDILDPRTGTRGFTTNWALCVADVLTDLNYGVGADVSSVNTAQLIAAANVCDEQVTCAQGLESRYTCSWTGDTSSAAGDILNQLMPAAGGRLSYIGGEWFIWPAYWQGPSFTFDDSVLTGDVNWKPSRSSRDMFNRVKGTYTAPWFPYAVAGNLYDHNGWYDGTIANTFNLAWQPTDYPYYAQDHSHGFPTDQWLAEDLGVIRYKDLNLAACISVSQAQRVAKIELLRNRFRGAGTLRFMPTAYVMQPTDVMNFNFPIYGWSNKMLEVQSVRFGLSEGDESNGPTITLEVDVAETDASIYEDFGPGEEQTVNDVPALAGVPFIVDPPSSLTLTSGAGVAIVGVDGVVTPRIQATWTSPQDVLVTTVQIQYQISGATDWIDNGNVSVTAFVAYISPVVSGTSYNVRIRSLRANGAASTWVEVDNFVVGVSVSNTTGAPVAPAGTLVSNAFSDGTADIEIANFTTSIGTLSAACTPTPNALTGLNQSQLYYVYYVDPTFLGGNIVPIATQNVADYQGKVGFYFIGQIVTTANTGGGGGGGGSRYAPSSFADVGSRSTATPAAAYDGDTTSLARVSGTYSNKLGVVQTTAGDCIWQGFPAVAPAVGTTLNVTASFAQLGTAAITCTITAHIGGSPHTLHSTTVTEAVATYTAIVGSGTDLSTVTVEALADGASGTGAGSTTANISVFEIWIS